MPASYSCPICKDAGFLLAVDNQGNQRMEARNGFLSPKLIFCECKQDRARERKLAYLNRIDGLTARERALSFDTLNRAFGNSEAMDQIAGAVATHRGLVTLTGAPGTGKTTLLICAVNAAKERNLPAVYVTMAELFDHLRAAYAPGADVSFDERWHLLANVEVLALDEIDAFNTTAWAMERFLTLMDLRWRNMTDVLTLCASNVRIEALPEKVYSRLNDGRAVQIRTVGPDMRPYLEGQ